MRDTNKRILGLSKPGGKYTIADHFIKSKAKEFKIEQKLKNNKTENYVKKNNCIHYTRYLF